MKKFILISLSAFMLITLNNLNLYSNVKILQQHKAITDTSKKISSCNDCHNTTTKLEKKKGANYKALYKTASCAGKGCHK